MVRRACPRAVDGATRRTGPGECLRGWGEAAAAFPSTRPPGPRSPVCISEPATQPRLYGARRGHVGPGDGGEYGDLLRRERDGSPTSSVGGGRVLDDGHAGARRVPRTHVGPQLPGLEGAVLLLRRHVGPAALVGKHDGSRCASPCEPEPGLGRLLHHPGCGTSPRKDLPPRRRPDRCGARRGPEPRDLDLRVRPGWGRVGTSSRRERGVPYGDRRPAGGVPIGRFRRPDLRPLDLPPRCPGGTRPEQRLGRGTARAGAYPASGAGGDDGGGASIGGGVSKVQRRRRHRRGERAGLRPRKRHGESGPAARGGGTAAGDRLCKRGESDPGAGRDAPG